jgi:hypothetical protein
MELKDFISKTLQDITDGAQSGHEYMVTKKSHVNGTYEIKVDFDVNVTVEDNSSVGGSAKVTIAHLFSAGANADTKQITTSYSKIRFTLPIKISAHSSRPPVSRLPQK